MDIGHVINVQTRQSVAELGVELWQRDIPANEPPEPPELVVLPNEADIVDHNNPSIVRA